jgi:uncharacterized membrane protein
MNLGMFLTLYFVSVPIFFLIDMVWLGLLAKDLYQNKLGHLLGPVQWGPAILFYLLFLIGLTFFATYPAAQSGSIKMAALYGGLFGFFTYLTYDLTNLATLKDWPTAVVVPDILWGTFIGAVVAGLATFLYLSFFA